MSHLDAKTYAALLQDPSQVDAALRAHLFSDCPTCVEFLASQTTADALDGRVDAALLRKCPQTAIPFVESARTRRRGGALPRAGLAAAAGLLLILGIGISLGRRSPSRITDDGIKGPAMLTVSSSFAVVTPEGKVRRGIPGEPLPGQSALAVRVVLSSAAQVSLVRQGADGTEVLLANAPMEQGAHDLAQGGAPVGISLQGHAGPQRLKVVACARSLTSEEILEAASGAPVAGSVTTSFDVLASP